MATIRIRKGKPGMKTGSVVLPFKGRPTTQAQWKQLQKSIDAHYPKGRFVAVDKGRVLADGATFREVDDALNAMGKTSQKIIVMQAGDEMPDYVHIFL
jgi:hypothetical protein